jgi:TetR/AcrR family transcriptional regulator, transcriptional repressor for nem operon
MRKSRIETAETRDRIVFGASALFRERGLSNVSVAELMSTAGLTHGGFYAHFGSREHLVAEAIRFALAQSAERIYVSALKDGRRPGYSRLIERYLSPAHRDNPQSGCALASLGSEVARDSTEARSVFSEGFGALVTLLAKLSPERTPTARRTHVLCVISALTGALVLARAVNDPKASEEILLAVKTSMLADEKRRAEKRSND